MDNYIVTLKYREEYMPLYGKGGKLYPGHHGIDIIPKVGATINHPVALSNGQVLGLMGDTGLANGAHTHIDKSIDGSRKYSSYRSPSDWFSIQGIVTFAGDLGTAGKTVIIKADSGHIYRFLHFNEIKVKTGQRVGGKPMTSYKVKDTMPRGRIIASEVLGWDIHATHKGELDAKIVKGHGNKEYDRFAQNAWDSPQGRAFRAKREKALKYYSKKDMHDKDRLEMANTIVKQKKEIDKLKSQIGETDKWTVFKSLIRELFNINGG